MVMNTILPFKSGYVIHRVTRSLLKKREHYPIFEKVLPDLCCFDKFALPNLMPIFQFSPARDIQENNL